MSTSQALRFVRPILSRIPDEEAEDTSFISQLLSATRRLTTKCENLISYSLESDHLEGQSSKLNQHEMLEHVIGHWSHRFRLGHETRTLRFNHQTVQECLSDRAAFPPNQTTRMPSSTIPVRRSLQLHAISSNYLLFRICFKIVGSWYPRILEKNVASMPPEVKGLTQYSAQNPEAHTIKAIGPVTSMLKSPSKDLAASSYYRNLLLGIFSGIVDSRSEGPVLSLLDNGAEVDDVSAEGWTPLTIAAIADNTAVVEILLKKGADFQREDSDGRTPLDWSLLAKSWRAAEILLQKMSNADFEYQNGRTLLLLTLSPQEQTSKYIRNEAFGTSLQVNGNVLFLSPASDANIKSIVCRSLYTEESACDNALSFNGDIFLLGKLGKDRVCGLPWHTAALLISRSQNIDTQDFNGRTALSYAAESGLADIVSLLLECGAKPDTKDAQGVTPLMWASRCCTRGQTEFENMTVYDDASMILGNILVIEDPLAALACLRELHDQKVKVIHSLLKTGSDINAKDDAGNTALRYALDGRIKDIVELLLDSGAILEFAEPRPQHQGSIPSLESCGNVFQSHILGRLADIPGLEELWLPSKKLSGTFETDETIPTTDISSDTLSVAQWIPSNLLPLWQFLLHMPACSFRNVSLHGNSKALCGNIVVVKIPGATEQQQFAIFSGMIGQHHLRGHRTHNNSSVHFPIFYAGTITPPMRDFLQRMETFMTDSVKDLGKSQPHE